MTAREEKVVHHIDGNPYNSDLANLRLLPERKRGQREDAECDWRTCEDPYCPYTH